MSDREHGRVSPGEPFHRLAAGMAIGVGLGAALSPARLLALYGIERGELGGAGDLGWRLMAIRTLAIGAAAMRRSPLARDLLIGVQAPDQLAFAHGATTGTISPRSAALASATSAGIVALCLTARRRDGAVGSASLRKRVVTPYPRRPRAEEMRDRVQ